MQEAQPIAGTLLREHVKSRVKKELLPAHAALGSALEAVEAVLEKEAGAVDECPFGLPVAKVEDTYYQIYPRTGTAAEQREKDFHMYTCICTNAFGFKGFNPTWIDGMFRVRESGSVSPPMANLPGWAEKCKSKTHTAIANVVNSTTKVVGKIGKTYYNGVTRAGALIEIQAINAEIARLEASGLDPEEVDRLKKLKKEVWVAMLEAQDDFAQQVDGLRKSLVEEVKGIETQALGCLADESDDCKSLWRKTLGLFSGARMSKKCLAKEARPCVVNARGACSPAWQLCLRPTPHAPAPAQVTVRSRWKTYRSCLIPPQWSRSRIFPQSSTKQRSNSTLSKVSMEQSRRSSTLWTARSQIPRSTSLRPPHVTSSGRPSTLPPSKPSTRSRRPYRWSTRNARRWREPKTRMAIGMGIQPSPFQSQSRAPPVSVDLLQPSNFPPP
tara:strand:- start:5134 stop:6456 length:1323 start_codon:yes stop_codon:yes gene_type:complete